LGPPVAAKKPRRWLARIRGLVVLVLLLAVLSRIVVAIAFPIVLHRVAGDYNLDCSYDRLELSMLSGDAGLWNLTFTPKGTAEPIFQSEYVRGDISVLNLLRGRLAVWRVEADGVNILVDRNPDGTIPILKLLGTTSTAAGPSTTATASGQPTPIDLAPPLRIDALRFTHIRARIHDQSVTPPLDATFTLNLRLSNLGWNNTPVHFGVDLDADPILDAMHVEGEGNADAKSLDAKLSVFKVDGLRLHPLEPYLRLLGVIPTANEISLKAGGTLHLEQSAANPAKLAGALKMNDLSAIADGEEAAGLDHFTLDADSVDPRTINLADLTIDSARVSARRSADGRIRFGGVEYVGAPPSTQTAATSAPSSFAMPAISLGKFDLQHLSAGFHDDAVFPPAAIGIDVNNLSVKNIVFDPEHPEAAAQLSGEVRSPGLFEKATFQGTAKPFANKKTLDLSVRADGIAPTSLKPYLDALGIESRLRNASFACDVSADVSLLPDSIAADASIKGIKLSDSGDLIAMHEISLTGATYQLSPPMVRLKDIELAGPVFSIDHESGGALAAIGFATKRRPAGATLGAMPTAQEQGSSPPTAAVIPSLQIDHLAWKGIDIRYADQSLDPPAATALSDAGVELDNILLDLSGAPTSDTMSPGTIKAWAKIPKLIDSFYMDGKVTPSPNAANCDLKAIGYGFTGAIVAPYLKSIGIEPTLQNGSFGAMVKAGFSKNGVALDAKQIHLSDGDRELAGVDAVKIGDTAFSGGELTSAGIDIDHPRIDVTREADGDFALVGVRFSPGIFVSAPKAGNLTAPPVHATTAPTTAPAPALPFDAALDHLSVKDATLNWADFAQAPNVRTSAIANLELKLIKLGKAAGPAQLHADARIDGSLDSASVDGTVTPSLDAPDMQLQVKAQGLRAGGLAAYLPAGISIPLKSAQFQTSIQAGATRNPKGGMGARFIVSGLDYRDQGQPQPLLKVDSFRAIASRIDPEARIYAIDEISSAGVETQAARSVSGAITAMGLALSSAPAAPPAATTKPVQAASAPPPEPAAGPSSVAALVAQARQAAPSITVAKLDLNLKRLALIDRMRPNAAPLVVSDLQFRNMAPIDWGGKDAQAHPPTPFRMDCTVDPLIGAVTLLAQVAPLAAMPTASFDLTAADITGDGVTALVPEIKQYVDGSSLQSGLFHAHADTQFRVNRKGAWEVDLSRGFSTDLDIKDIAFRGAPGGPVLLGLDDIHSDAIHITPTTGDVHIKTLEITNPTGRIIRQADGIHIAGLVIKLPKTTAEIAAEKAPVSTTQPTTQSLAEATTEPSTQAFADATTEPATQEAAPAHVAVASAASTPQARPKKPTSEIRVDQLLISGIDFDAEDQTMTPPLIIPLNSLDVEVRDFTTMAPYQDRPVRFNALVNAGKVPIPSKAEGTGATNSAGEKRELFAQASANGQLSLYPVPHGWVKTSVSGLELAALKGAAHEAGVNLTGGVFDSTADARLPGDGKIHTSSRFVFTDLSLSEPPQGPIYRLLHLPAPLDVVIGALQDQEGSITVPIDVPVPVQVNKVSTGDLIGPAIGAFGSIVVTAIASAPLKAVGGVGDLFGLGGNKKHAPEPPIPLPFEPGYTALSPADQAQIAALCVRMKKDKSLNLVVRHDLGGGDITVANERANPSAQDARYLADQLRQQQLNVLQERSALAGTARAELAWGSPQTASATIAQLRTLDQQVAQNDDALDRLYGMLRPGADRQAARRTRGACLEYGRERLDAVKQALIAAGLTDMDRVHIASPQFSEVPGDEGGNVVVTLVPKKKD
jgi:hypothetical protein